MAFSTNMHFTICNILCQKVKEINYALCEKPSPFVLNLLLQVSFNTLESLYFMRKQNYSLSLCHLIFLVALYLALIIPFPGQTVLVCLVVSCMEDISYHLTFYLHFFRQVNQNKTQHLLCIHTRELTWQHNCIFFFGVAVFFPFSNNFWTFDLFWFGLVWFCLYWAISWHDYRAILTSRSLSYGKSYFRAYHFACKFKGVSPS